MLKPLRALALLVFSMLFAASAFAQTTVTLQQGLNTYAGAADNWIIWSSGADTNKGGLVELDLRSTSDYGLVRFSIFQSEGGPVPNGATITSATLSLYKFWGPDAVFKASRLLKPWTEMGSTWNATGTGALWSTPGAQGAGSDVLATADGQGSIGDAVANGCNTVPNSGPFPAACWLNIDVTAGVQAFASGASANNGWLLQQVSSSGEFNYKNFNSKEFVTVGGRPKLTITYTGGGTTPTVPTARLTAAPTVGTGPLAVTFDASTSTDGGSPITGLRLQFGDGTPDATWTDKNAPIPPHTYAAASTSYTVGATLIVSNAVGSSTSAPVQITVNPSGGTTTGPTARLTASPTTGTGPLAVTFDASTSAQGTAPITGLRLAFDDGSLDATWTDKSQPIPPHTYAARATPYNATLTVTDGNGLTSTSQVQITVSAGTPGTGTACTFPPTGQAVATSNGNLVPTFHNMSLYYNPGTAPAGEQIFMRYRRGADDPAVVGWRTGHPLWYDRRSDASGQPLYPYRGRGSAVHLDPGTAYVFEVSTDNVNWAYLPAPANDPAAPCASTWPETENFRIGRVIAGWTGTNSSMTSSPYLGEKGAQGQRRSHVLLADQSGSEIAGYTVYNFTAGAEASAPNTADTFPVVISGHHIILRGLKVTGGEAGIWIDPGSHDIVIENCDISDYARDQGAALGAGLTGNQGIDEDGGIKFPEGRFGPFRDTKRIIIQRNKIHNPKFGAHPWDTSSPHPNGAHPAGPSPIPMYPTGGQIVIRYNTVYSTTNRLPDGPADPNHFHHDGLVLGGCNEDTAAGGTTCFNMQAKGLGPDVDVYKNIVMHYWDDGTETDGDGINNRVWANYFDYGGASAVSTAPTHIGPTYVWRNVYNRARMWCSETWGAEHERLYMLKSSGLSGYNGGKRYIYHNTALQPPFSSEQPLAQGPNSLGAGYGTGGNSGDTVMQNTTSRNNVFETWNVGESAFQSIGTTNDLDYDLSNGGLSETNGKHATPQYQTGNGWSSYWRGQYRLVPNTAGHNDGVAIPNFNDNAVGLPDRGAHEDGTPDMVFGIGASGS